MLPRLRFAQRLLSTAFKPGWTKSATAVSRTFVTSRIRYDANVLDENFNTTTVNVLNRDIKDIILISSFSNFGFRLNSDVFALGPIAVLPTSMFSWTVATHNDISIESLTLFWLLEPKVDILIIGTGEKREAIDPDIRNFLRSKNISTEIQDTQQACATYNYLASEMRNVGVALIPPARLVTQSQTEELSSYQIKGHMFTTEDKETQGLDEAHALNEAVHVREFEKVWSQKGRFVPTSMKNYKEKLKEWKEREVEEDDKIPYDRFTQKTERDIIEEKKRKSKNTDEKPVDK